MTKRDVATWFCRIVGIAGVFGSLFNLLVGLFFTFTRSYGGFDLLYSPLALIVYGFVWTIAGSIGSTMVGEGEYGPPIESKRDLTVLTLRCIGLVLFIQGSLAFGSSSVSIAAIYVQPRTMPTGMIGNYFSLMAPRLVGYTLEATFGFFMAFGPRVFRAFKGSG